MQTSKRSLWVLVALVAVIAAVAVVAGSNNKSKKYLYNDYYQSLGLPLAASEEIDEVNNLGIAVLVLTHESYHLRQASWAGTEAKVECQAIRHVPYVIKAMGMKPQIAEAVYRNALAYHNSIITDPQYRQKDCQVQPIDKVLESFRQSTAPLALSSS